MKPMNFSNTNVLKILKTGMLIPVLVMFVACSKDDDSFARVSVNGTLLQANDSDFTVGDRSDFNGDIDASFNGNGGTAVRSFTWNNNLNTADYNADITASAVGNFQMIVEDAEGMVVLDRMIQGSEDPDSISGVTQSGAPGIWTVTIRVTDFNGDGSFSLSEGN
ncbi:hypothetical protein [Robiginitalea aurantiaca]|uniref:CHRD domain-containing protein n=1 Tax=Robiginitalea aurantiaca TaxID=3056915 RepID=A0ABT7WCH7_9FLAO|nr:hypothetical protein [Robiginitalea aurantiaca]MDM9630633.1 hypothetical protein [Robiginitalea aurantiaca]